MDASATLRSARARSGLTLRQLAAAAGTSHSTLSAYETGSKVPSVTTMDRIVHACGFAMDGVLHPRQRGDADLSRGAELAAVLELAEQFPARHADRLVAPVFPQPFRSRS